MANTYGTFGKGDHKDWNTSTKRGVITLKNITSPPEIVPQKIVSHTLLMWSIVVTLYNKTDFIK